MQKGSRVYADIRSTTSVGVVLATTFDTAVFLAVSYRLLEQYSAELDGTWSSRMRMFFKGQGMTGNISRLLLQTGQLYYLCAFSFPRSQPC